MGLSIVIYQALLYVSIFILLVLSISYLVNKIKRSNGEHLKPNGKKLHNHMSPIQTRIRQMEQQNRRRTSKSYADKSGSAGSRVYIKNHHINYHADQSNFRPTFSNFSNSNTGHSDQMAPRELSYQNTSDFISFR